jgi:putative phage-type endonuclease
MKVLAETKHISREGWLELRRKGIGGSDAAAVVGMNPWKSAFGVWLDKTGQSKEKDPTERMRIGTDLEGYVADRFAEETGLKVRRRNAILQHDEHPFMIANVDRLIVGVDEGLECKVTNSYSRGDWEDESIPAQYEIQCHHYMAVTGYSAWWIAALIGNEKIVIKRIERDEDIISWLVGQEVAFWKEHVEANKEPIPDGTADVDEYIKEKYPEALEGSVELTGLEEKLQRRSTVDELIKELEKEKSSIEQEVKLAIGDYEMGTSLRYQVTYKNSSRTSLDTKRIKAELPEIYQDYTNTSSYRTLRVKELK